MESGMAVAALGVAVKLQNLQISDKGPMERRKQARLEKVVATLLEFKSEDETMRWLTKKNKGFGNIAPIDLVESEYATKYLLTIVWEMRCRAIPFQKGDRVVYLETGEMGTVNRQFSDGEVSLIFDDGSPAGLQATSLKKIDMAASK